jgi:transcriptional regulator with GAF, ATPase, and Fis domain
MSSQLSNTTVLICDRDSERLQLVADSVKSTGARPHVITDAVQIRAGSECRVALIALGNCAAEVSDVLDLAVALKEKGIKVLSYAPDLLSWPIAVRCRALLSGASLLFDSSSSDFKKNLSDALIKVLNAEEEQHSEEVRLRSQMKSVGIVGLSTKMISVFRWVVRVSALSDFPVLITGETGTGKELIANALHQLDAKRRGGPFIVTNCSAISAGLAESELFGHRKGAFTGADTDRKGLFRSADGGILFLDEIGELSEALQAKLLRVLQEKRVLGVGFDQEVAVNVRVIAATNRSLEEMVKSGKFREDLYHRLNGLSVRVPPLHERPEDLRPLIEHFLEKYSAFTNKGTQSVSTEFVEALMQVELPGNARQVENIVRSALLNKADDSPLSLSDLAPSLWQQISTELLLDQQSGTPRLAINKGNDIQLYFQTILDQHSWNLPRSLEYCEKIFLQCVLQSAGGNQSRAARLIGITPRSVYNKLQKYKLHPSS